MARDQIQIDAINEMLAEGRISIGVHNEKLGRLAIQIEGLEYRVGEAYGMLVSSVAAVHVLSAASVEAHINFKGEDYYSGRWREAFERLSR